MPSSSAILFFLGGGGGGRSGSGEVEASRLMTGGCYLASELTVWSQHTHTHSPVCADRDSDLDQYDPVCDTLPAQHRTAVTAHTKTNQLLPYASVPQSLPE